MSTDTSTRHEPLTASAEAQDPSIADVQHPPSGLLDTTAASRRDRRFADGLRSLRTRQGGLRMGERTLLVLGGVIAPLGIVIVLLGWWGASRTPHVFEQVPYLISGGLLGVALVFLGAFFYFAHWLTELVREHRAQSAAIIDALTRLQHQVAELAPPAVAPADAIDLTGDVTSNGDLVLVATPRGTLAHRSGCVVVAGKTDLRRVSPAEGLSACKLCLAPDDPNHLVGPRPVGAADRPGMPVPQVRAAMVDRRRRGRAGSVSGEPGTVGAPHRAPTRARFVQPLLELVPCPAGSRSS